MLKKAIAWVTLISFTLSCSGCHSAFEGRDYPTRVTHEGETQTTIVAYAGEIQTTPLEKNCGEELWIILIFAALIAATATGNMHGSFSASANHDFIFCRY